MSKAFSDLGPGCLLVVFFRCLNVVFCGLLVAFDGFGGVSSGFGGGFQGFVAGFGQNLKDLLGLEGNPKRKKQ